MSSPWLIGGPSRCGKSTFADAIANSADDDLKSAALRVDALLHKYRKKNRFKNKHEADNFLKTYLQRPRYMNPECTEKLCPVDDANDSIENVITKTNPTAGMTPLDIIFCALNVMAENKKKESWVVLDLLPELYFEKYKATLNNLKLLIIIRDPIEAIAASMYWRSYPTRTSVCGKKTIEYFLFLWCLSASTSSMLKEKYPDDVFIISTDELFCGEPILPDDFKSKTLFAELENYYSGLPYFSFKCTESTHYCPDNTWHKLLNENEITYIDKYKKIYWQDMFMSGNHNNLLNNEISLINGLLKVAKFNPIAAKLISDNLYMPKRAVNNFLARLKSLIQH